MNCLNPSENEALATVTPLAQPGEFTCIVCRRALPDDQAAWDNDPEKPATLCLGCVDDQAPAPEYSREVA